MTKKHRVGAGLALLLALGVAAHRQPASGLDSSALPRPNVAAPATAQPAATETTDLSRYAAPPPTPEPQTKPAPSSVVAPQEDDHGGTTAMCADGTLSYAAHHRGACSYHGGVATWYR